MVKNGTDKKPQNRNVNKFTYHIIWLIKSQDLISIFCLKLLSIESLSHPWEKTFMD
jgi:hypothetical protein